MPSKKMLSLFIIACIGFLDLASRGLVYPLFSSMLYQPDSQFLSADITDTMRGAYLGIVLAAMPLTQFFSAPILGMLSDSYGRRKIIVICLLIGCAGYLTALFASLANNIFLLIFSRVGVGISAGAGVVINAAIADISSFEDKAKNFGISNMAMGLGLTLGPLLGGLFSCIDLGFMQGCALVFLGASLLTLLNLFIVVIFLKNQNILSTYQEYNLFKGICNIKNAYLSKNLRPVFLALFFTCLGWSFYWEFASVTWITQYKFDAVTVGYCYAYAAAFYALNSGFLIRPFITHFSTQTVLFYALLGCSFTVSILLIQTNMMWIWVYIPLQQFSIALFWPTAITLVSNSADRDQQGKALGVFASVESLAAAMSPLMAGPLLGISSKMPMIVGSGIILFAAILFKILYREKDFYPHPMHEKINSKNLGLNHIKTQE